MQVLQEALAVVQRCQQSQPIQQLWKQAPLPQQAAQQQQPRAVGKHAEVSTASPLKQQKLQQQQQAGDVQGLQDVGGLRDT